MSDWDVNFQPEHEKEALAFQQEVKKLLAQNQLNPEYCRVWNETALQLNQHKSRIREGESKLAANDTEENRYYMEGIVTSVQREEQFLSGNTRIGIKLKLESRSKLVDVIKKILEIAKEQGGKASLVGHQTLYPVKDIEKYCDDCIDETILGDYNLKIGFVFGYKGE